MSANDFMPSETKLNRCSKRVLLETYVFIAKSFDATVQKSSLANGDSEIPLDVKVKIRQDVMGAAAGGGGGRVVLLWRTDGF